MNTTATLQTLIANVEANANKLTKVLNSYLESVSDTENIYHDITAFDQVAKFDGLTPTDIVHKVKDLKLYYPYFVCGIYGYESRTYNDLKDFITSEIEEIADFIEANNIEI